MQSLSGLVGLRAFVLAWVVNILRHILTTCENIPCLWIIMHWKIIACLKWLILMFLPWLLDVIVQLDWNDVVSFHSISPISCHTKDRHCLLRVNHLLCSADLMIKDLCVFEFYCIYFIYFQLWTIKMFCQVLHNFIISE